jgi:hypothetical protein
MELLNVRKDSILNVRVFLFKCVGKQLAEWKIGRILGNA